MYCSSQSIFAFTPQMTPAYRVPCNQELTINTMDCFSNQLDSGQTIGEIDFNRVNPATGPFYIEGVEAGDILVVHIKHITLNDYGHVGVFKGFGLLNQQVQADEYLKFSVNNNHINFAGRQLPTNPMIGVIGVATAEADGEVPTGIPGKHGGNMDTKDIRAGTTLYLQANCDGAMFAVGDFHAAMGDGELTGSGGEIAGAVTLSFDVIKAQTQTWPKLETEDEILFICSDADLTTACQIATNEMVNYIQSQTNLTWAQSYMLASLKVDMRISQLVNPKKTVRAAIKKSLL